MKKWTKNAIWFRRLIRGKVPRPGILWLGDNSIIYTWNDFDRGKTLYVTVSNTRIEALISHVGGIELREILKEF